MTCRVIMADLLVVLTNTCCEVSEAPSAAGRALRLLYDGTEMVSESLVYAVGLRVRAATCSAVGVSASQLRGPIDRDGCRFHIYCEIAQPAVLRIFFFCNRIEQCATIPE